MKTPATPKPAIKPRIDALDYLRGYFILVIIIDHLYRWPSALAALTGQGLLWFNAADGFVIVSGLMIGYIRGYKGLKQPLKSISEKLWKRAGLLYLWLVIGTLAYTGFTWLMPAIAGLPYVPIAINDWSTLIVQTITMQFSHVWINFLYLYAIFLAIAPAAILLLRRQLAWVLAAVSIGLFIVGDSMNIKWLQWQPLFFVPMIAGFYLESIRQWWSEHTRRRTVATYAIYVLTFTFLLLAILTNFILPSTEVVNAVNAYFDKGHLQLGGLVVSFVVFCGFVLLFVKIEPFLKKRFAWILLPFGTYSLTVYIIHGVMILLIAYMTPVSSSIIFNTLLGLFAVIGSLLLLKIPLVQRFIPR